MIYDFVTGDSGNYLRVTIKRKDGTPYVLTGATSRLRWEDSQGAKAEKTMTITDATNGIVEYNFINTELFTPVMVFEVEVTDAGGKTLTGLELITVNVREQIA